MIPQKTLDYVENLNLIKPEYVIHGDDWKNGIQKKRDRVIKTLKNGQENLLNQSIQKIFPLHQSERNDEYYFSPDNRVSMLKRLMNSKKL